MKEKHTKLILGGFFISEFNLIITYDKRSICVWPYYEVLDSQSYI